MTDRVMTDREKLIKLLTGKSIDTDVDVEYVADFLLKNGVIVAPMPMAEWLRKELSEYVYERCLEEL